MFKLGMVMTLVLVMFNNCESKKLTEDQIEDSTAPRVEFNGTMKVLSLNAWQEGTMVNGGFDALVEIIIQTKADVVMLCEIRNYNNTIFSSRISEALKNRGETYYTFNSAKSPIILSRFPILSKSSINSTSLTKCIITLNDRTQAALYAAHLDYTHYACYLPRGYDGNSWEKLPDPILDIDQILEQNKASQRDEAIQLFVNDAEKEKQKGNLVFLAGDFNEPSHLDWGEDTKDLFDHNGMVVPWHNSITLKEQGYLDAYRIKYENPITHPGFTWAAYNTYVNLSKLIWAPEADDRDRIDFIYYDKNNRTNLEDIIIVGPTGCIANGQGYEDTSLQDKFLRPNGIWPSDHKGVLATFKIE